MPHWTQDQLQSLAAGDDLHIAPLRADGVTRGTPTWIWSVVVGEDLYVRPYNGVSSRWHQSAVARRAGQIHAIGQVFEVTFEPADATLNDRIDAAYREKYASSAYMQSMISERARATTIKVVPAGTSQ